MGWWTKFFKGHESQYKETYGNDRIWDQPQTSVVGNMFYFSSYFYVAVSADLSQIDADLCLSKTRLQDELAEFEQEDIDFATALSLSEEDQKVEAVIGEFGSLNCYSLLFYL